MLHEQGIERKSEFGRVCGIVKLGTKSEQGQRFDLKRADKQQES